MKKILVIDDDQQFRSVLARSFSKRGCVAIECSDPKNVLHYIDQENPTHVVVDLKMPHISGLEVISLVHQQAPKIKIVMLTGYGSIATAQEGIKRGAHYYLTKPCDADKILQAFEDEPPKPSLKEPTLAQVEWEHINRVLFDCSGNITKASKVLGMGEEIVTKKISKGTKSRMKREIILASSSPRRKDLLTEAGVQFRILSPNCDETVLPDEIAENMVSRLALLKAETIAANNPEALVIGADTTVFLNCEILGKPLDNFDACNMLAKLQDKVHEVWGGMALVCKADSLHYVMAYRTEVKMLKMSPENIAAYVATSEPLDKAGSYAIQGIGSQYVEWIHGSYTNVVGLNIAALMSRLRELGYVA